MNPELSNLLKDAMSNLPFVSGHLPGIGGVIKAAPEHFEVEEILSYEPCGEGEHVFVKLRRKGWNTADVGRALGEPLGIAGRDIGWAGRKDKNAVTTQTISLRLPVAMRLKDVETAIQGLPFDILSLQRHRNKLKMGHAAANRFRIVLSQSEAGALNQAKAIAAEISRIGLPNYYGTQRFGTDMRNMDRAAAVLKRGKAYGKQHQFLISALQSALFNIWLKQRFERGEFNTIVLGDLAKKTDTGGMFVVEDLHEALQRFHARQIGYTGPIYGHKMRPAGHLAAEHEKRLLDAFDLETGMFKPLRAPGSRRVALIFLNNVTIDSVDEGLQFLFSLPSGAYATTVLREFTRETVKYMP
jgi:tRNA pseudouridine13 synthase